MDSIGNLRLFWALILFKHRVSMTCVLTAAKKCCILHGRVFIMDCNYWFYWKLFVPCQVFKAEE